MNLSAHQHQNNHSKKTVIIMVNVRVDYSLPVKVDYNSMNEKIKVTV